MKRYHDLGRRPPKQKHGYKSDQRRFERKLMAASKKYVADQIKQHGATRIIIPQVKGAGPYAVFGLNGTMLLIPRGTVETVPAWVVDVARNCIHPSSEVFVSVHPSKAGTTTQ